MEQLKSALNTALKREGLDSAVRQNKALFHVGRSCGEGCCEELYPRRDETRGLDCPGTNPCLAK